LLKEAFQRNKYYWIAVFITSSLAYGFTLTNFSMGVDDESFDRYFMDGSLLAQGRWGAHITKFLVNTYDFLPFWRDFIGVLLIIAGITLWGYVIQKFSSNYFNNTSIIVFSCVAISCPLIADNFIFMMTTIEMGIVLFLVPLSINYFFEFAINQKSLYQLVISMGVLTYAISFTEAAVVFFLIGLFITCFVTVYFSENKDRYTTLKTILVLMKGFSVIVAVLVINSIITNILQIIFSVSPSGYTSNYIQYDFGSLRAFIESLLGFLEIFFGFSYIGDNLGVYMAFLAGVLILLYSTVFSIMKKKIIYVLLGTGCVLAAFSMYFITGNVHLVDRIFITHSIFTGFVTALLYMYFQGKRLYVVNFGKIMGLIVVLIVLYQTKDMNKVFYTDYLRYQLDIAKMNSIAEEIEKHNGDDIEKEVVFIGLPENYNLKLGDTEGYSIFQWDRTYGLQSELKNSGRIFRFMNLHGYDFNQLEEMDEQEIINRAGAMPEYPEDGYVKDFGEYLIVKIGPAPYETSELTLSEFYKIYNNDTNGVNYTKDWFSYEENILTVGGWGSINGVKASETSIQVALINDERQYFLKTDNEIKEGISVDNGEGLNNGYRIFSFATNTLVSGTYDVVLIFNEVDKKRVISLGETIQIH